MMFVYPVFMFLISWVLIIDLMIDSWILLSNESGELATVHTPTANDISKWHHQIYMWILFCDLGQRRHIVHFHFCQHSSESWLDTAATVCRVSVPFSEPAYRVFSIQTNWHTLRLHISAEKECCDLVLSLCHLVSSFFFVFFLFP